ncbi:MAG: DUF952 domain-containing protein [Pseudomonadota bacterium]
MSSHALIFKVCPVSSWETAERSGIYTGAPVDLQDGFIHFSTAGQLGETVAKHFAGEDNLLVVAVPAEVLGEALKWEPSRGGDLFPHLYGSLQTEHAAWTKPLPFVDGRHVLPDLEGA